MPDRVDPREPTTLNLVIPLAPYPQPRPRHTRNGQTYVPKAAREARLELQTHLIRLTAGQPLLEGPLAVEMLFVLAAKRDRRKDGDADNLVKFVWDAANGTIWVDDRQVKKWSGEIVEEEVGRIEFSVRPMPAAV